MAEDATRASYRRSLASLDRSIASCRRVIAGSRRIADEFPDHRASALARLEAAEPRLIGLESERRRLEALVAGPARGLTG